MKRMLMTIVGAGVVGLSVIAHAEDAAPKPAGSDCGFGVMGSVGIGYGYTNAGARDPSKLNEYRDLHDGGIGAFEVKGRGCEYYVNAYGENLGRDDQYLDLNGGKYDTFKYKIYNNNLVHRIGIGPSAISPYSGVGGPLLTTPVTAAGLTNRNPATWQDFDNSYRRQDIGAMFEVSAKSPFYVRFEGNQVQKSGLKESSGAAQGTSPGNGFIDLPTPVAWTTNYGSVEVGYQTKRGHIALNVQESKFSNENPFLRWTNGFFGATAGVSIPDTTVLAPDSDQTKVSLNGNLRQLPGNSTLAGRITYTKTTNNVGVLQNILDAGNTNPSTGASSAVFGGNIVNKTSSLALTSHLTEALDTRVFWNWSQRTNNSNQVNFTPASATLMCSGGPCVPDYLNTGKSNLGFEGAYRINPQNRVTAGFDYQYTSLNRIDYDRSIERKYSAEWKNSAFDKLDTRVKYQFMQRRSLFTGGDPAANPIDPYMQRFDLATVDQQLAKVVFDLSPVPLLNLGLEGLFKHNDYTVTNNTVGRQKDDRQELYASIGWGDSKAFRVMLFADVELVQYDSTHRNCSSGVCSNPNPSAPAAGGPPSTTYTWTATDKDHSYLAGLGMDWLPTERWIARSSLTWAKTKGSADFAAQQGTVVAAPGILPIQNFDNTLTTTFNMRATYKFNSNLDLTGGYAYQRFRLSDISTDSYGYVVPAAATTQFAYASGLYAFNNFISNTVYVLATFKFSK